MIANYSGDYERMELMSHQVNIAHLSNNIPLTVMVDFFSLNTASTDWTRDMKKNTRWDYSSIEVKIRL